MAAFTVDISDLDQLVATLTNKTEGMDHRTAMVVRKAAFDVERHAKVLAPYKTGFLRNSIVTEILTNTGRVYAAEVRAEASYAKFQEFGTVRMAPHPFLGPAVDKVTPGFLAALAAIADPLDPK